jgi:hypothetical protein
MPDELCHEFSAFAAGQKRTGMNEKEDLGLDCTEGEKAMTLEAYELVAKHLLFLSDKPKHVFTHLFLVLDW